MGLIPPSATFAIGRCLGPDPAVRDFQAASEILRRLSTELVDLARQMDALAVVAEEWIDADPVGSGTSWQEVMNERGGWQEAFRDAVPAVWEIAVRVRGRIGSREDAEAGFSGAEGPAEVGPAS